MLSGCFSLLRQRRGGKGRDELANGSRGRGRVNPPRCPPRLCTGPELGKAAAGTPATFKERGAGCQGCRLLMLGCQATRAYDLLHCSASVRSLLLGSCHCRAAGTHTPARTHGIPPLAARAPAALASPGTQVLETCRPG